MTIEKNRLMNIGKIIWVKEIYLKILYNFVEKTQNFENYKFFGADSLYMNRSNTQRIQTFLSPSLKGSLSSSALAVGGVGGTEEHTPKVAMKTTKKAGDDITQSYKNRTRVQNINSFS